MAKPKRVRATTHPIGQKINEVMAAKGMPGDYAALAKEFGVAITSVYGWVEKGRISKDRLPKLAEWSGQSLEWWLSGSDEQALNEEDRVLAALRNASMRASPRSLLTIEKLTDLAKRNALKDDDWALIEQIASKIQTP